MDSFHQTVRHTIRVLWQDPKTREKLRQLGDENMGEWSCGASANRLCELLAGDDMRTIVGQGIDVSKDRPLKTELGKMRASYGRLVARVQLRHKVAGHALVWVSEEVEPPHTLEGYIYQTNIGVKTQEFDLLEWVDDDKSTEKIYLPAYLTQLQAAFGVNAPGGMEPAERAKVYQREFMTQGKVVTPQAAEALENAEGRAVMMMWRAADDSGALGRLGALARQ